MPASPTPTTVELTAKRWKVMKLVGMLITFLGVFLLVGAGALPETDGMPAMVAVGGVYILVGPLIWITARVLAWWHHG